MSCFHITRLSKLPLLFLNPARFQRAHRRGPKKGNENASKRVWRRDAITNSGCAVQSSPPRLLPLPASSSSPRRQPSEKRMSLSWYYWIRPAIQYHAVLSNLNVTLCAAMSDLVTTSTFAELLCFSTQTITAQQRHAEPGSPNFKFILILNH
jgi:hypothetical protein